MKQRVLSGIVIGLIALTSVYFGGWFFRLLLVFIATWGCLEFCKCRKRKINWLEFIFMLISLVLINLYFKWCLQIVLALIVILLSLAVFDENYSLEDACVTCLETLIWSYAIYQMQVIENYNKWLLGYIVIIAFLTDVFALFAGMKFGKHKLNERISPKKTIEGAIGGWLCGAIIAYTYASFFDFFGYGYLVVLLCCLILPIISQIGDLIFSLIKRYYGIKDFSKLIPGHGGILDRLDSFTFVLIIFGVITSLF